MSSDAARPDQMAEPVPGWWLDVRLSPVLVLVLSVLATLCVGLFDYVSGPYLAFSAGYMIPVAFAAWFNGRPSGVAISLLAGVEGLLVAAADPGVVEPLVVVGNSSMRVAMFVFVVFVVASARTAMDGLHASASTDPMTGLLNRRRLAEQTRAEFARAARTGHVMAVVFIDIDDLKVRNDTEGHEAGDAMLCQFATAVRSEFRVTDLLARLGGDEFAMVMPDTTLADAVDAVARLRRSLDGGPERPVHFSAGIVAGAVDAATNIDTVLDAADALMFDAKGAGKNRTCTGPMPGSLPNPVAAQ